MLIVATKRDLADGMGDDSSLEDMIWEHTRPLLTDFGVRCAAAIVASTCLPTVCLAIPESRLGLLCVLHLLPSMPVVVSINRFAALFSFYFPYDS